MNLLLQFIALSLYVWFMGFTFCDGFKLHIIRKLIWFSVFVANVLIVFKNTGEFSLTQILPLPIIVALFLCWQQQRVRARTKS